MSSMNDISDLFNYNIEPLTDFISRNKDLDDLNNSVNSYLDKEENDNEEKKDEEENDNEENDNEENKDEEELKNYYNKMNDLYFNN